MTPLGFRTLRVKHCPFGLVEIVECKGSRHRVSETEGGGFNALCLLPEAQLVGSLQPEPKCVTSLVIATRGFFNPSPNRGVFYRHIKSHCALILYVLIKYKPTIPRSTFLRGHFQHAIVLGTFILHSQAIMMTSCNCCCS